MSKELIAAYTKATGESYPGYVNISRVDGNIVLTVRGDPAVVEEGSFVCGYEADRGKPGRCTPGDANCNNYCNSAPEKGPMQDAPKRGKQVIEGKTVQVVFTEEELMQFFSDLGKGK